MKTTTKNKGGRPSKYRPEYCDEIVEYFSIPPYTINKGVKEPNDLRFITAFARSIDVCKDTLYEWAKVYPEFSVSLKRANELQTEHLVTNGLHSLFAQPFAIFTAKNISGWRDKKEIVNVEEKKLILEYPKGYTKPNEVEAKTSTSRISTEH